MTIFVIYFLAAMTVVRPNERALVETMGRYSRILEPGFSIVWPIFQKRTKLDISEQMSDIEPQEIITEDNLNAKVDLVVFYKLRETEEDLKRALYKVQNVETQIQTLARTTARNVIGTMPFKDVNSKRNHLNEQIFGVMEKETKSWGIEITRVEMKDITPPNSVQETMNKVIQAENAKRAAIDTATALETEADGQRRAQIKLADGTREATVLKAKGEAESIKLVNEAAEKYFTKGAQRLKELEVTQASLENNTKYIVTEKGISPQIILGDTAVIRGNK